MIEVTGLSKSFKIHRKQPGLKASLKALFVRDWIEKHALKEATLHVSPGEIVGLVGANGAGKTTLIKLLAGIIYPSSGTAKVLGYVPWERNNNFRRQIALIMGQKAQLWWDLPAGDSFLLLKEIYEIEDQAFNEQLDFLTATLDVKQLLNLQLRRLSLGERMKMELIAALLHKPKVIYLDEPTIGLDITAQRSIRTFLADYCKERKPAIILTSHYMQDILELCKRIIIIRQGEFVYEGTSADIAETYQAKKFIQLQTNNDAAVNQITELLKPQNIIVEKVTEGVCRLPLTREQLPAVMSEILKTVTVEDITVEDEDITSVIENIMRFGKHV